MGRLRDRRLLLVRGILAWICAGHVITGLVALLSDAGGVQIGSLLYGASFEPTSQFLYIIRPLGVYILALAYLQAMAVWDPWRYRAVIDVTIAVFVARQLQRLIFAGDIMAAFGIPPDQHWLRSAYFLVLVALLLLARLRLRPDFPATPVTPSGTGPGAPELKPGVTR
jgi:hypothetical protein